MLGVFIQNYKPFIGVKKVPPWSLYYNNRIEEITLLQELCIQLLSPKQCIFLEFYSNESFCLFSDFIKHSDLEWIVVGMLVRGCKEYGLNTCLSFQGGTKVISGMCYDGKDERISLLLI